MILAHNHTGPRLYGNGVTAATPIEGAARLGYLDGVAKSPFRPEYHAAMPQWQRNYEAGRQWAIATFAIGLTSVDWPEGARVPAAILAQLGEVRAKTGSGTRPEDTRPDERPRPLDVPLRAVVPFFRRGRIVERITP